MVLVYTAFPEEQPVCTNVQKAHPEAHLPFFYPRWTPIHLSDEPWLMSQMAVFTLIPGSPLCPSVPLVAGNPNDWDLNLAGNVSLGAPGIFHRNTVRLITISPLSSFSK